MVYLKCKDDLFINKSNFCTVYRHTIEKTHGTVHMMNHPLLLLLISKLLVRLMCFILVSPADGSLTYIGLVQGSYLEQIKGIR